MKTRSLIFTAAAVLLVLTCLGCETKDKISATTLSISISPSGATVQPGQTEDFTVSGFSKGSDVTKMLDPRWAICSKLQDTGSSLNKRSGTSVTFTAGDTHGSGTLRVEDGKVYDEVTVTVGDDGNGNGDPLTGEIVLYDDDGGIIDDVNAEVLTWQCGDGSFEGDYADATAPEGSKSFQTVSGDWAGWGIFYIGGARDFSNYEDGRLVFWLKSDITVKVEVEDVSESKGTKTIASTGGEWQEITIPASDLSAANFSQMYGPFLVTAEAATTFYVDHVRWFDE